MVYNDLMQNPLIVPVKTLRAHDVVDSLGKTVLSLIYWRLKIDQADLQVPCIVSSILRNPGFSPAVPTKR